MRIEFLGCPIDLFSFKETLRKVEESIQKKTSIQHVVVNADKILKIKKDVKLKNIIKDCTIINVDGMSVLWALRICGYEIRHRITGIDLMGKLVEIANNRKYSVYLLGARQKVIEKLVEIYSNKYPDLRIAGWRNGYWSPEEELRIVKNIKDSAPDILFVGMNSPKKEFFINKYLGEMDVPFSMGVGGAFDVVVGIVKRSPKWIQNIGLEWLFRLVQEPRRLWKRYLIGNTIFIWLVLKEFIRIRLLKRRNV